MTTEGIFRVPGNSLRMAKVEQEFNQGRGRLVDFKKLKVTVEDASSLLKKFLRESLDQPLFPTSMQNEFHSLENVSEPSLKNAKFLELFEMLPPINKAVVKELLKILVQVNSNCYSNLMDTSNISTVFGAMASIPMKDGKAILAYMIEEYSELFETSQCLNSHEPVFRRKLINHMRSIFFLAYIKDKYIISADSHGLVNLWDSNTFKLVKSIGSDRRCYTSQSLIEVESSNIYQLWTFFPESIRVWDLDSILNPNVSKFEDSATNSIPVVNSCACAQVGRDVWIAGQNVQVWDVIAKHMHREIEEYHDVMINSIGYVAGYVWIWRDNVIHLWDPHSFVKIHEIIIENFVCPKTTKYFQIDGNVWITTEGGSILVIELKTFQIISTLVKHHTSVIYDLVKIGPLVWSCSWDTFIIWWEHNPPKFVCSMPNDHKDAISCIVPVWREQLNGWDVWTSSWDRSIQVNFIPSTYYEDYINSNKDNLVNNDQQKSEKDLQYPKQTNDPRWTSASRPKIPDGSRNLLNSTSRPKIPLDPRPLPTPNDKNSASKTFSPAPSPKTLRTTSSLPPSPPSSPPHVRPLSQQPQSKNFEDDRFKNISHLQSQIISLQNQIFTLNIENDKNLDEKILNFKNQKSNEELLNWIKEAHKKEYDLQIQIEDVQLKVLDEIQSMRYSKVYESVGKN